MTHRIVRGLLAATGIAVALGLSPASAQRRTTSPDDWPTYNRTFAGDRFSPLTDITPANAARLQPVCTFDTGEQVSFQTGPVVVNGVMYLTSDRATFAIDEIGGRARHRHRLPSKLIGRRRHLVERAAADEAAGERPERLVGG